MLRTLLVMLLVLLLSVPALERTATAQEEGSEAAEEQVEYVDSLFEAEPVGYQVTLPRVHGIIVPNFLLDAFFDIHPGHWDGRTNFAFGAEFLIRRWDTDSQPFDLIFSLDWANLATEDEFWKESGEEAIDTDLGENSLSLVTLDVSINWFSVLEEYWHLYYGLGLGVAVVLGDFLKTDIERECFAGTGVDPFESTNPRDVLDNCYDASGNPMIDPLAAAEAEDGIPPLLPSLSFTLGSRWIIEDNWVIQLEGGLKTIYFYTGLELGYTWR